MTSNSSDPQLQAPPAPMPFDEFRIRFEGLRSGWNALSNVQRARARFESPDFNLFKVLGIHSREVKTHSALLANLFDPNGTHGQGDLFLRAFLEYGAGEGEFLPPEYANLSTREWESVCEVSIQAVRQVETDGEENIENIEVSPQTDTGRLDIVLRNPNPNRRDRALIVIENKIYARDQEEQLIRYESWLQANRAFWPRQALLYLTLDGREPKKKPSRCRKPGDPESDAPAHACISYREHIREILASTVGKINSQLVATVVRQYLDLIPRL